MKTKLKSFFSFLLIFLAVHTLTGALGCRAKKETSASQSSQEKTQDERKSQGSVNVQDKTQTKTQEDSKSAQQVTTETTIKVGGKTIKIDPVKGYEGPADEVNLKSRYNGRQETSKAQEELKDVSTQASGSQEQKSQGEKSNKQNTQAIEPAEPGKETWLDKLKQILNKIIAVIVLSAIAYAAYRMKGPKG